MAVEIIERDGIRYAELLRNGSRFGESAFFSPPEASFQFGVLVQQEGYSEPAHYHLPVAEQKQLMSELIVVQSGAMAIAFYTPEGRCFEEVILRQGDAIILVDGSHSYRVVEELQALVVKQGPFQYGADKVPVTVA